MSTMHWHDYLALLPFAAATAYLARRAWRALYGRVDAGCGHGCSACGKSNEPRLLTLLTIGPSAPEIPPKQTPKVS
jgi:hypothetical protein